MVIPRAAVLTLATGVIGAGVLLDPPTTKAIGGSTTMPPFAAPADGDFYENGRPDPAKVELGRLLFFDKILSGNKNIACATCHHPTASSGDALSLPIGEGGIGLGPDRYAGPGADARVPRNAPPLFNLGAREFTHLFHDGRVAVDKAHPSGFGTPAGDELPLGLDTPLAAQALFPPTSPAEMAGQAHDNPVGAAAVDGVQSVWAILTERLRSNPEYGQLFAAAFEDVASPGNITIVHAANAIAAFEATAFRADNSPYDEFLRGNEGALTPSARRGLELFYGDAGCANCHSGPFQTDHDFHAIAMPQIGPGKGDGNGHEDYGRERITGDPADRYKFRTPSLRNVALTGPWGHSGAYATLEAIVRHHMDPVAALHDYDSTQAILPPRPDLDAKDHHVVVSLDLRTAISEANSLTPVRLTDEQIADIVAFLRALTDPSSQRLDRLVPDRVPSDLPVAD